MAEFRQDAGSVAAIVASKTPYSIAHYAEQNESQPNLPQVDAVEPLHRVLALGFDRMEKRLLPAHVRRSRRVATFTSTATDQLNGVSSIVISLYGGVVTLICINLSVVLTQTQGAPWMAK